MSEWLFVLVSMHILKERGRYGGREERKEGGQRAYLQVQLMPDRDDDGVRLTGELVHVLNGDGVDLVVGVQAADTFPEECEGGKEEGRDGEVSTRKRKIKRGGREGGKDSYVVYLFPSITSMTSSVFTSSRSNISQLWILYSYRMRPTVKAGSGPSWVRGT